MKNNSEDKETYKETYKPMSIPRNINTIWANKKNRSRKKS
jgi:hypothetical protein